MKRIRDLSAREIYSIFFDALKNRSGKIFNTKINGENKLIFIFYKNPFDKRVILDLESLSVYQIKTFLGKITSIDQILDIDDTRNKREDDRLKEQLEKISDLISDDLKKKFIERLKVRRQQKKQKVAPKKVVKKAKPRPKPKPKPRKPMMKRPMVRRPVVR